MNKKGRPKKQKLLTPAQYGNAIECLQFIVREYDSVLKNKGLLNEGLKSALLKFNNLIPLIEFESWYKGDSNSENLKTLRNDATKAFKRIKDKGPFNNQSHLEFCAMKWASLRTTATISWDLVGQPL